MKAFLTGSQVYGIPNEESDVDVVLLVEKSTLDMMVRLLPKGGTNYDGTVVTVMSGKINLILTTTDEEYRRWRLFTETMTAMKPVSKEAAMKAGAIMRGVLYDQ